MFVSRELLASVIRLGGRREHFHDDNRVEEGVKGIILKLGRATDNDDIGIKVGIAQARLHPHIAGDSHAVPTFQSVIQFSHEIRIDEIVGETRDGHCNDLSIEVFAFEVCLAFQSDVFLRRKVGLCCNGGHRCLP